MSSDFSIQHIQQTLASAAETVKTKLQDRDVQKLIAKGVLAAIGAIAFSVLTAGFGVPAAAVVFGAVMVFTGDFALLSMLEKDKELKDESPSIPMQELAPVIQPLPVEERGVKEQAALPAIALSSTDRFSEAEETELMAQYFANMKPSPEIAPAPVKKNSYFERMKETSTLSNDPVDSEMALYVEDTASKPVDQPSSLSSKLLKGAAVASFIGFALFGTVAAAIDVLPYPPIM